MLITLVFTLGLPAVHLVINSYFYERLPLTAGRSTTELPRNMYLIKSNSKAIYIEPWNMGGVYPMEAENPNLQRRDIPRRTEFGLSWNMWLDLSQVPLNGTEIEG